MESIVVLIFIEWFHVFSAINDYIYCFIKFVVACFVEFVVLVDIFRFRILVVLTYSTIFGTMVEKSGEKTIIILKNLCIRFMKFEK